MPNLCPQNSTSLASTAIIGCTLLAISWLTFSFLQRARRSKQKCAPEFVEAGKVHELFIYPIKSCKGNKVDWLDCGGRGSRHGDERDRHFLVIDALQDNLFLTARIYPKLVLLQAHVQGHTLRVEFPSDSDEQNGGGSNCKRRAVEVDLEEVRQKGRIRRARLFNDARTEGLDCGDQIGQALGQFLGVQDKRDLRLIWFASEQLHTERDQPSRREYWHNEVPEVQDKIGYSDLSSYMGFSLASLEDLNGHLATQGLRIDSRNFRPNLVVSGLPPFDEDRWLRVRVGRAEFVCYKPCTRCVLTTVDPERGRKCEKMEPLRELRRYRLAPQGKLFEQYKESPIFGVNMTCAKAGRIQVGDTVRVQYKPSPF